MIGFNKIYNEDVISGIERLNPKSIHCCVTSPPYYGLRDYKLPPSNWPEITFSILGFPVTIKEQECCLGLEKTPMEFVGHIVFIFRKVKEALRNDGTLWLNFGDSYAGSGKGAWNNKNAGQKEVYIPDTDSPQVKLKIPNGIKPKDMIGIPWMVAFALRDDGWYLRMDNIWNKPNVIPESVNDRPTKCHEFFFLLSKSKNYYFDAAAISEECSPNTHMWISQDVANQVGSFRANGGNKTNGPMKALTPKYKQEEVGSGNRNNPSFNSSIVLPVERRNKRSVWTIPSASFSEAHFATFPKNLIVDPIKAGCPEEGVILDPFMGAGTTAIVARKLNRNYIGFELNPYYIKIAEKRLYEELGMFP